MSVTTGPGLQDVVHLAREVWASFLGEQEPLLEGEPVPEVAQPISATVGVSGGWTGTIGLHVPEPLARTITTVMLGVEDVTDADVSDAVGELVNVVGGNIKSLMPGPSTLSIPVVARGRVLRPHGTVEVVRADLAWAGRPVSIAVHVPAG